MTKSELIERLSRLQPELTLRDMDLAVNTILGQITESLAAGVRVEVRSFGSFSLRYRASRVGRNPKTGEPVALAAKHVPHFKPGKALRARVIRARQRQRTAAVGEPSPADGAEGR